MKHLYIRIPDELHARVKEEAGIRGISMNQLVIRALNTWLDSVPLYVRKEVSDSGIIFIVPKIELNRFKQYLEELDG